MKKKHIRYFPDARSVKGFSLIEFLVASALSMIVLIAVTSGYFTARNLNTAASNRLSVQQDLRNASNLVTRDARMAGSFGCFNMTAYTSSAVLADTSSGSTNGLNLVTAGQNELVPVKLVEADNFGAPDFTPNGSVLVFQYGVDAGSVNKVNAPVSTGAPGVLSTCSTITRPGTTPTTPDGIRSALGVGSEEDGNISVMRYTPVAYAVGTSGGQEGFFRFTLDEEGSWSNPQLLVAGVSSGLISYIHVTPDSCPETATDDTSAQETFDYNNSKLDVTGSTPALIRFILNGGTIDAGDENNVAVYHIDAAVRGGNTCADRSI